MLNGQMPPGSHLVPMNASLVEDRSDGQIHDPADNLRGHGNCPVLKEPKDELEAQAGSTVLLAAAFSEFILASSRLETSYRELQEEVSDLRLELSARNAALSSSLAENERMRLDLQQIVDSMPCGVLVLGPEGEISMINPESGRLLGLDQAHFREGSPTTLRQISTVSGVNLESLYQSATQSNSGQEFCVHDVSGKRWLEVRNRRLFDESGRSGQPEQTILILRDVSAQRRAEQEREAGRRAMALAEITTILAHEIRNPLASLELFGELIENDSGRRDEWISNLRAGIRSLSATVNNVLSFHGSGSLKLAPVDLSALIRNAIQFVGPLAAQAAVSLEWLDDHAENRVMGNESALQQVVLNLVSNAIRYTPAGGAVIVSVRSDTKGGEKSGRVIVEFADTGCGIRPAQIDHVFAPGFSGSGDTCGLGLAVCDRIMKQHDGEINVSRGTHAGARFALHFPLLRLDVAIA